MERFKKILKYVSLFLLPTGLLVILGFAIDFNNQTQCQDIEVEIAYQNGLNFVDQEAILSIVKRECGNIKGKTVTEIDLDAIEKVLLDNPYIEDVSVYKTIGGKLKLDIGQRVPLLRVFNMRGEDFYIDRNGFMMPVSPVYTARVPVVSGYVKAGYSPSMDLSLSYKADEVTLSERVMKDLYALGIFLRSDIFWSAWFDQIYVNSMGEFELIPKYGGHAVELGDIENLEDKMSRLMIFYINGMSKAGWHTYKRLNLKYKNQIVCSK
ncbi:MAG: hypothetical protein GX587_02110 [Bacteroidales bacterium]|nr:hypothetical protein [Bacteroidales bacterium]